MAQPNPHAWALFQAQMGNSFRYTAPELAIICYEEALTVWTYRDQPEEWVQTVLNLSRAYLEHHGDPAENTEQAIAVCEEALKTVRPDVLTDVLYFVPTRITVPADMSFPKGGADLFHELGHAYLHRIDGDRSENVEIARRAFMQAQAWSWGDPLNWAAEGAALAEAYIARFEEDPEKNLELAIDLLHEAAEVFAKHANQSWTKAVVNLAMAYLHVQGEKRTESIERAINLQRQVLKVRKRRDDPLGWASATAGLADALREGEHQPENIEEAIRLYKQVLTEVTPEKGEVLWATALLNLGWIYQKRQKGRRSKNVQQAIDAYRRVLDMFPARAHPMLKARALRDLAHLYFGEGRWEETDPVFAEAIKIGGQLLETAVYEADRQSEVHRVSPLYAQHAYCLLRLGRYGDALVQLEAGKTRLLALAVALTAIKLESLDPELREAIESQRENIRKLRQAREAEKERDPQLGLVFEDSHFVAALAKARADLKQLLKQARAQQPSLNLTSLSLQEILALIPKGGALVAPVITSQGSAVFIVPHGVKKITTRHVLCLDGFSTVSLSALLSGSEGQPGWLRAYTDAKGSPSALELAIDAVTALLWDQLVGKISERLQRLKVRHVLFLPQGGLGLLPLHAAWRMVGGERRYLSDDFEVVYAPSAYALDAARRRVASQSGRVALVIGVSQYEQFNDLPYTGSEAQAIAGLFETEPLLDSTAPPDAIIRRVGGTHYLHLACHGVFAWGNDPLASSLYLAGDRPLSLAEIIGRLDLQSVRLATLSACETGVIDVSKSPDEFFGLTAGFMQGGASGVVSSLWTVNDRSTALLMEHFYYNHLKQSMEPAAALRAAQFWLRALTREKLSQYLKARGRRSESREILSHGPKYERLYESPYYWAAFTYNGI
jgi:CHAT domain-containing protein/tetratricopeptide (TPR) repeat protein